MDQHASRVVTVEIHGQQYPIRSGLDPAYVAELAAYVDEKMRLASRESPAGDTLKLAVLAALNIADEYFRILDDERRQNDQVANRAAALERMVDLALGLADGQSRAAAR
ncbi:MAG: cell division protein ZapA [Acidobacteriota bacterium]|jgi:cell division protein ZapA|nr:cell division protein ZapA [Acidobacteriota bacterium]